MRTRRINILLLGSGGRESAFAWKLAQSAQCKQLFIGPGNAGTSQYGNNVGINSTDFASIKEFALDAKVDLVVVGPEEPLVKGIHDFFLSNRELQHISIIGPQAQGAQLEGSKHFAKEFMSRHHIPTAVSKTFSKATLPEGLEYLQTQDLPIVLKADGLAAGKGVLICTSLEQARWELMLMLQGGKFGLAGSRVIVEQFLQGLELSVFVLTDGKSYKMLPAVKDYKRIGEGDTGLNTGGMGAVSPVPFADTGFLNKVEQRIVIPTIEGLRKEDIFYKGFLFIGLMRCQGDPYVVEYNCRMGDPEAASLLTRVESDLVDLLLGVAEDNLSEKVLMVSPKTAVTVVCVSKGYPEAYATGKVITGMDRMKHSILLHAGTTLSEGLIKTSGGRVMAVTCLQNDLRDAMRYATADAHAIDYEGKYFRRDIGADLI